MHGASNSCHCNLCAWKSRVRLKLKMTPWCQIVSLRGFFACSKRCFAYVIVYVGFKPVCQDESAITSATKEPTILWLAPKYLPWCVLATGFLPIALTTFYFSSYHGNIIKLQNLSNRRRKYRFLFGTLRRSWNRPKTRCLTLSLFLSNALTREIYKNDGMSLELWDHS